ncbi:HAD family hydrolase [Paenibacillus turpanensis]|uniref:HAD family hydrolase n=1 Tax=Paenibacillus turpanensis TaxID=2689078 RepID=UPI00140E41C4|nr:HAD family hydrolase [Paenibacillus turpanensis]
MAKPQTILFDLDDTLSHCNKYFDQVSEQFSATMNDWFGSYSVSPDEIKDKQVEIDLTYVKQFGLTSEHFKRSFVETYYYFCEQTGKKAEPEDASYLTNLAMSVYDQQYEPYPHTYEILQSLKEAGHQLHLHTGGEEHIQKKKISQLELAAYFGNRIFISKHKNTDALRGILDTLQCDKKTTWMVGNSLRTDILPALELGINAIHIPAENEWEYNNIRIDIQHEGIYETVPSLLDVPSILAKHQNE